MDLSVTQTKIKEKRERQPNWTEAEKQLLLSLTRLHQVILENKGSDTLTIKRKSDAWDEIASNMRDAGYQRTKERLKQQLGRIRAAEAKKAKDALVKGLSIGNCSAQQSISMDDRLLREDMPLSSLSLKRNSTPITVTAAMVSIEKRSDIMPTPLQEEIEIKIEKATSLEEFEPLPEQIQDKEEILKSPTAQQFSSENNDLSKETLVTLQSFSALGGSGMCDAVDSQMPSTSADAKCRGELPVPRTLDGVKQNKWKARYRISARTPISRGNRVRQLHLHRIAVERERLRTLRLQQKRDRALYHKDMQIQNLKLQILRNLANQNRSNHINL